MGHILWLAKAKPPAGWGSYHIFLNRAGPARGPPSRVGGVRGRHSVNLSLAACASRALRFESNTTLNNGYLGSRNDEERSEMRYLV